MRRGVTPAAVAAAVAVLLLSGCGDDGGGSGGEGGPKPSGSSSSEAKGAGGSDGGGSGSGSGSASGKGDHGTVVTIGRTPEDGEASPDSGRLEVDEGERFSFATDYNVSARLEWKLGTPAPDAAVVGTAAVEDVQSEEAEKGWPGAGSTRYFTFEAKGTGSTEVVLEEVGSSRVVTYHVVVSG